MDFTVITGMSGAGKSTVVNTLEDLDYHCIDNMPVSFIAQFIELVKKTAKPISKVAFVIDVRGVTEFDTLLLEIEALKASGNPCKLVFLDCSDETIIMRYKETRRKHPLQTPENCTLTQAIADERRILEPAKKHADYVLDTTHLMPAQLKETVIAHLAKTTGKTGLMVTCMSFGFKHGIPIEADIVLDVRCFPNPYYIPELKTKTGLDAEVRDYVMKSPDVIKFMAKLCDMFDFMLPLYTHEGKAQLIIAVGCTGGKHRSVAIAEALNAHFADDARCNTFVIHRDILKSK